MPLTVALVAALADGVFLSYGPLARSREIAIGR